jgi:hypothetical protein
MAPTPADARIIQKEKVVRVSYLGHLGKLEKEVRSLTGTETIADLELLATRLSNYEKKLLASCATIQALVDEDALENEVDEEEEVMNRVMRVRSAIEIAIVAKNPPTGAGHRSHSSSSSTRSSSSAAPHHVQLPKLEISKFSGDFLAWRPFHEQFRAAIGDTDLPAVSKLTYLLSYLEGDARNALSGMSCTAENYEVALKILKERFGNPSVLIALYAE